MLLILFSLLIASIVCIFSAGLVGLFWNISRSYLHKLKPPLAADVLFLMEISGIAAAFASVLLFVVPGFMAWEPRDTEEKIPVWVISLAVVIVFAIGRTFYRLGRDLHHKFSTHGYQPLVAVHGILRSRLVCSDKAREVLTDEELDSVLRHENAHVVRHDNLRELMARFAAYLRPSFKFFDEIVQMRRRFTEYAADSEAVNDENAALNLAAALVHLARHVPTNIDTASFCISSAIPDASVSVIAARVERLLHFNPRAHSPRTQVLAASFLVLTLFLLIAIASQTAVQTVCYRTFERVVSL